jgi:hypothetical protein
MIVAIKVGAARRPYLKIIQRNLDLSDAYALTKPPNK